MGLRQAVGKGTVHQCLDLNLHIVGQLGAIRAEQLDSIVLIGVVRGGDHHAQIGPQGACEHRHGGRRKWPEQGNVHAGADKAGGKSGFQHVTGQPCVLADDDAVAVVPASEQQPGGLAQTQGDSRRHWFGVSPAPDTIGAEQASCLYHARSITSPVGCKAIAGVGKAEPCPIQTMPAKHELLVLSHAPREREGLKRLA